MSQDPGPFDESQQQQQQQQQSGEPEVQYWEAPSWRVRVTEGDQVHWVDLKHPFVLIGSHRCCGLRIGAVHLPEVVYFACCLRDRVEVWPTAAIAFPRWGTISGDDSVMVGSLSLTFQQDGASAADRAKVGFLAEHEIRARFSSPTQDSVSSFRRPVTIVGDDHPSVIRFHGRGMLACHYAAVVQDQSLWIVDLSPRRMPRFQRIRRLRSPGERLLLGETTLEFLSVQPIGSPGNDHPSGNAAEVSLPESVDDDGDLHSDGEPFAGADPAGASMILSSIHRRAVEPPPANFESPRNEAEGGSEENEPQQPPQLCLVEHPSMPSRAQGIQEVPHSDSAEAALSLVDTALGLVDVTLGDSQPTLAAEGLVETESSSSEAVATAAGQSAAAESESIDDDQTNNQSVDHDSGNQELTDHDPHADAPPRHEPAATLATLDPEALTTEVTLRLAEIAQSRSLLQQKLRWSVITTGILVPLTVLVWVIQKIYSDWH